MKNLLRRATPFVVIVVFVCMFFGVMLYQSASNDLTNERIQKLSKIIQSQKELLKSVKELHENELKSLDETEK